jgi:hypothetical protein
MRPSQKPDAHVSDLMGPIWGVLEDGLVSGELAVNVADEADDH